MFSSKLYRIMEWVTRFAYLNLLWIGFTLIGLGVVGFFPSTIAMFAITRDWLKGKTDFPIFRKFWSYYKQDFMKSNLLGVVIIMLGLIVAIDIYYITMTETMRWINIPLFAFMILILLFLFYLFPAFVHFDVNLIPLLKNAFLIMLISPIHSLLILISLGSLFLTVRLIPALAFIFGGSIYSFITMWLALHAFNKVVRN